MQEVQHCQDVRVPSAVQEEAVQVAQRKNGCFARAASLAPSPAMQGNAPITEGEVRRTVHHGLFLCGLRGALVHASLHRSLLSLGLDHG